MTIRMFQMDTENQQLESQNPPTTIQQNLSFFGNEAIVEAPTGTLKMALVCNASFPVAWYVESFENNPRTIHSVFRNTRRLAPDPLDHSSFKYVATTILNRLENVPTGRYICRSTRNRSLSNSVYLYWKGNADNVFVDFKTNITLTKKDLSDPHNITLPCVVSTPNATVVLYKFNRQGRIRLVRNDSIMYDPKVGFTLLNFQNISGYYRCFTTQTNWDNDYVGIIVPSLSVPKNTSTNGTQVTLKSNPSIRIDAKRQMAVCCSGLGGTKSPKMFNILCNEPITCDYVKKISNIEHWFHRIQSRQTRKNDCTTFKLTPHYHSGVIQCTGPDFNIQMNYIFPMSEIIRYYSMKSRSSSNIRINTVWTTWEEIIPEEMMIITEAQHTGVRFRPKIRRNESQIVYDGEQFDLLCVCSPYYFAGGIKWALKFKNGTVIFRAGEREIGIPPASSNTVYMDDGHHDYLSITANKDLTAVVCLAPIWNSSLWVHNVYNLYINESINAQVVLLSEEKIAWNLNDTAKYLQCNATGSPLPTFTWYRDEQSLENGPNIEITEVVGINGTVVQTVLKIQRVSHRTGGVYKCEANNSAGSAFKIVTVQIAGQTSWHHAVAITVGVISAVGLLAAIGFFIWKIKTGQDGIRNLSNGIIQEFENDDDTASVNIHNKTYDPSTLNADLLD
ncbi:unnamed protein product [Allacma fusca]|uniref:Ig-like domain-containing protein n=1 Tax=Allacma fusca TaxID=39272 RepID=A0A8J2JSA2_9HEXA|nr:unnamed protein product [Allacma fusca]